MCYSYNLVYPISALRPRLAQAPLRLCDCTLERVVTYEDGAPRRIGAPAEAEGENLARGSFTTRAKQRAVFDQRAQTSAGRGDDEGKEQIEMKSNATMATLLLIVGAVAAATLACDRKGVHVPGDTTGGWIGQTLGGGSRAPTP